jgi:hypothetical protein
MYGNEREPELAETDWRNFCITVAFILSEISADIAI